MPSASCISPVGWPTSLKLSNEDKRIVRLAALVHDIGHAPFSHTSEYVLRKFTDPNVTRRGGIETIHEAITINLLQQDEELHSCLSSVSPSTIDHIVSIIRPGPRTLPKEIVSGPLDADKLDYIYRDAHQAGVSYGVIDLDKIIESLDRIRVSPMEEFVGVREDGVWAIEQLLLAKYHMNAQVYRHRVRRITDAMLVRGLTLAVQEGIGDLKRFL